MEQQTIVKGAGYMSFLKTINGSVGYGDQWTHEAKSTWPILIFKLRILITKK